MAIRRTLATDHSWGTRMLGFHKKRGFDTWFEYSAPFKKWKDRYGLLGQEMPQVPGFMIKSYRGKLK